MLGPARLEVLLLGALQRKQPEVFPAIIAVTAEPSQAPPPHPATCHHGCPTAKPLPGSRTGVPPGRAPHHHPPATAEAPAALLIPK